MPRKKSEIAKRKVNYYVPEDLLTELEQFRRDGESDTDFYTRLMEEGRARLKGILTGETPIDPVVEAQVLAVLRDAPVSSDRLNVNGGAIALGHPIGATGVRIVVTLLHEMERRNVKRGLATLCVSGGMGMAMAIERD